MTAILSSIAEQFGTPCFVYHFDEVRERAQSIRDAFGGRFRLSYAVKCNPNAAIIRRMAEVVDRLDISSGGELRRAIAANWEPQLLSFTGPAKRDFELHSAVTHRVGHVVVESVREAERLAVVAAAAGVVQPVLIRIAPAKVPAGFGSRMAGKPSQFGIDQEVIDDAVRSVLPLTSLDLQGFHVYAGTQCLNANAVAENLEQTAALFRDVCEAHDLRPTTLIFGSGFGIRYYEQDQPLDLADVAGRVSPAIDALRRCGRFTDTEMVLELGRYLVGEAGVYLTRVVSSKRSRGTEIRLCDGGMNHHLGACGHLGSVIPRNYRMFKVGAQGARNEPLHRYDLFGPLCTSIDALAHGVMLPSIEVGDVIGIHCSGAYGPTASPLHFISHDYPFEVMVECIAGEVVVNNVSMS